MDGGLTAQRLCLPKPEFCRGDPNETHYLNTFAGFVVATFLEGILLPVQRARLARGKWVPTRLRKANRYGDRIRS